MLKSDVEKDAQLLMQSLKSDYQIPSSGEVIFPVIRAMLVVYVLHIVAIIVDVIYYNHSVWLPGIIMWLFLSCGILTVVALMMTYGNLSMLMCIPKNVRDNSLLLNIAKKKLKSYYCVVVVVNIIVAAVLISERSDFILGYGFSWFACMIVGGLTFSMSMSRYMTPAVVAALNKVRQIISSGTDVLVENNDVEQKH